MVDKGRYILLQYAEAVVQFLGIFVALGKVGYKSLLIYDILPYRHCIFLKLVDVQEEFFVDVFLLIDSLAVLGNLLGH